jgi:hypothetical protein
MEKISLPSSKLQPRRLHRGDLRERLGAREELFTSHGRVGRAHANVHVQLDVGVEHLVGDFLPSFAPMSRITTSSVS